MKKKTHINSRAERIGAVRRLKYFGNNCVYTCIYRPVDYPVKIVATEHTCRAPVRVRTACLWNITNQEYYNFTIVVFWVRRFRAVHISLHVHEFTNKI